MLFARKCIQISADRFDALGNFFYSAFFGAFEHHMLYEM